jgi:hypothetical protein
VALRPARLLPPKRLLTPRSARCLSATNRGLLPGFPAITRVGLTPTGLVQLSGRTMERSYVRSPRWWPLKMRTMKSKPTARAGRPPPALAARFPESFIPNSVGTTFDPGIAGRRLTVRPRRARHKRFIADSPAASCRRVEPPDRTTTLRPATDRSPRRRRQPGIAGRRRSTLAEMEAFDPCREIVCASRSGC